MVLEGRTETPHPLEAGDEAELEDTVPSQWVE
jgi:hypothetical protein